MDYLGMILQGYFNQQERQFLDRYIYREFKKAEKEHYEVDEFFIGCLKVVELFEYQLNEQLYKRKEQLYKVISAANDGTLGVDGKDESKTKDEWCKETIEICKKQLAELSVDNFSFNLSSLTRNQMPYIMWNNDVAYIKQAIAIAYNKVEKERNQDTLRRNFSTFEELFEKALLMETIPSPKNKGEKGALQCYHHFCFNIWLQENKGWEYGNGKHYQQLLTKENWKEYIQHERQMELNYKQKFEKDKADWQITAPKNHRRDAFISQLIERSELYDFLSVTAPDILNKDAFWHDEQDKPISCNIYHPKYGYPGFEANSKDIIVTSFNPVTVYQDCRSRNYVYCRYYLDVLCTADEMNFTNKDGEKVIKVDWLQKNQKRLAETKEDFEWIYQKEFENKKVGDKPQASLIFWQELANHIRKLIELHKKHSTYKSGIDINLLALANEFLEYGESKIQNVKEQSENVNSANTKTSIVKSFSEYLLHENRELLADKLKAEFTTEIGKGIRLLIEVLQCKQPQLLNIENRQRKAIYNALKLYFGRDIGTYQAVFTSYKFDASKDQPDFDAIKARVDFILKSMSK